MRKLVVLLARAILLSVPGSERVPPLRLTTRGRRLRSAALLSGGTSGSARRQTADDGPWPAGFLRCGIQSATLDGWSKVSAAR